MRNLRMSESSIFRPWKAIYIAILCLVTLQAISTEVTAKWVNYWPFWVCEDSDCDLVFHKENFIGPIIEQKYTETGCMGAIRPIGLHLEDYKSDETADYFLYPLFSRHQAPHGSSWNILNLISRRKSCDCSRKLTVFPLFFSNQTCDPCTSYSAIFPLGGTVHNYLGTDSISWVMFPLYLGINRKCTVRHGLPWPFIRWQTGPDSGGGALWPLGGHYWKKGKYDHEYMFWPLIYKFCDNLSDPVPSIRKGFLPFYAYENSAKKEAITIIWPFFSHIEMHNRNYIEDQFLWPFFVQGRGENEYVNRWAPFYTHSIRRGTDKRWFLWPLLKIQYREERGVRITQEQLLYFVFWKQRQQSLDNPCAPEAKKMHLWPFYSYWDNGAGQKQFQFFSPLEVFFPENKAVRYLYSPLFAIFRCEQIAPGHTRQSILFDLIAAEKTPCSQRFSIGPLFDVYQSTCKSEIQILKGLLGYKKENGKKSLKFLWITF